MVTQCDNRFHMGWFLSFHPPVWTGGSAGNVGATWGDGSFLIEMIKKLERGCFDYMMLEDSSKVPDIFRGNAQADLAYANFAPKHDPVMLVPLLAAATNHIGVVVTMSTSFYPPYLLARAMSTLDHITHGRVGWNIVTSSGDRAAQNFGLDAHYEHDHRYDMADEFTDVVMQLWNSWEPDALVMDHENGVYVDHTKVHTVDFVGKYYKVRGPLNTLPSPQGHPVICQAGGSDRGRDFAARHAETIIAAPQGVADMTEFRDDIRGRMKAFGRDPDTCKIMFITEPVIGHTESEIAEKRKARLEPGERTIDAALALLSAHTEVDFAEFDLDAPLPQIQTNGHQASLASLYHMGSTVREVAATWSHHYVDPDFIGTPDQVADRMGDVMQEVGGDGFLINAPMTHRYVDEIVDGLVPALQARGLMRTSYEATHFRDNLMAF